MIWIVGIGLLVVYLLSQTKESDKSILSSGSPKEPEPITVSNEIPVINPVPVITDYYNYVDNSVLELKTPLIKPVLSIPDPADPDYYSKLNDYNLQLLLKT